MNLLDRMRDQFNSFTQKEQVIASYIIQRTSIQNENITVLAKELNTSPATITRFCKKVGCKSFIEMKMELERGAAIHKSLNNQRT